MVGARAGIGEGRKLSERPPPRQEHRHRDERHRHPEAMMVYRSNGSSMAPCRPARRRENSAVGAHREDGGVLAVPAARGGGWSRVGYTTTRAPGGMLGRVAAVGEDECVEWADR
jgi:hypothetical protein